MVQMLLTAYDTAIARCAHEARDKTRDMIMGNFYTTFLQLAPVLKDHHFSEEKEWRVVTLPRHTTDPKFRATVSNTRVSQYYVYDFEPNGEGEYEFLNSVALGPIDEAKLFSDAIWTLCRRNCIRLKSMTYSRIPYRG